MDRKHTAWKKSRKFGDIYGGRQRKKLEDNIFNRAHSLKPPDSTDVLPILIEDNPSRDYFFPLSAKEAKEALFALPKRDYTGITHIWLRRLKTTDYVAFNKPLAEFICGSGVRLVVLYPWPIDLLQPFGSQKPSQRVQNEYAAYDVEFSRRRGTWVAKWSLEQLRKFYIQGLLYHEVGHHVDWYFRHWSKANRKMAEDFADQYAFSKSSTSKYVFNRLQKETGDSDIRPI